MICNFCLGVAARATLVSVLQHVQLLSQCCSTCNFCLGVAARATLVSVLQHVQLLSQCCSTCNFCLGVAARATLVSVLQHVQLLSQCCSTCNSCLSVAARATVRADLILRYISILLGLEPTNQPTNQTTTTALIVADTSRPCPPDGSHTEQGEVAAPAVSRRLPSAARGLRGDLHFVSQCGSTRSCLIRSVPDTPKHVSAFCISVWQHAPLSD